MSLKELRKRAKKLNLTIKAVRDDVGWGYWLDGTGWEDNNFCTSHDEITGKLELIEFERTAVPPAQLLWALENPLPQEDR